MIDFGSGTLYMNGKPFANGNFVTEIDIFSADESPPIVHKLLSDKVLEISLEMPIIDVAPLMSYAAPDWGEVKQVTMQYEMPIMVQARWHKKKRINKKWLRRFGMKEDTVLVKWNSVVCEYDTGTGEFELESDVRSREYLWRPDQLGKNFKIEM